jgi:alpha-ribazole phosphatase
VTLNLLLVRHGKAADVDGRCIGHTDVILSAEGRASVHALALRQHEIAPARIISSDLARAAETARILAESWNLRVEYDARLRELNFGVWDGRYWTDIERDAPAAFRAWADDWQHAAPPGGESLDGLLSRAAGWLHDRRAAATDGPIMVVSHAGWIRALLTHALDLDPARLFDVPVDYADPILLGLKSCGPNQRALSL